MVKTVKSGIKKAEKKSDLIFAYYNLTTSLVESLLFGTL